MNKSQVEKFFDDFQTLMTTRGFLSDASFGFVESKKRMKSVHFLSAEFDIFLRFNQDNEGHAWVGRCASRYRGVTRNEG